jgi:hypothetical protein
LPYFNAERLSQALHCLDFNLGLISTFQLLIELKLKTHDLCHLLLGKISPQPEIAKILGKAKYRRHRVSYSPILLPITV